MRSHIPIPASLPWGMTERDPRALLGNLLKWLPKMPSRRGCAQAGAAWALDQQLDYA
jgi:hypothetical protein